MDCSMQTHHSQVHRARLALGACLVLTVTLLCTLRAEAARVTKVKGTQVLIDIESSDIQEGQKYFIVIDGKKRAVVMITKTKNGKAIGNITKGRAEVDAGVEPVRKASPSENAADSANAGSADESNDDLVLKKKVDKKEKTAAGYGLGFLLGYAMDSQSLPDPNSVRVTMSGSGYSLKAFGDLPLSDRFGLNARAGLEQFSLTGSSSGGSWNTSILYATADGLLRFNFTKGKFVPWVGAGLAIMFPASKTSNILNVPQISATTVFLFDLGADIDISKKTYLATHAELGYFPPSNNITTMYITLRAGLGFRF